jgi:hypothetical protein
MHTPMNIMSIDKESVTVVNFEMTLLTEQITYTTGLGTSNKYL